jgi:hypothetical protein
LTDNQGAVRFTSGTGNDQKFKVFYRADDKADWELIIDEADEGKFSSPLRFNRSGNGVYFSCAGQEECGWAVPLGCGHAHLQDPVERIRPQRHRLRGHLRRTGY